MKLNLYFSFVIVQTLGNLFKDFKLEVYYFISIKVKYKFENLNFYFNKDL